GEDALARQLNQDGLQRLPGVLRPRQGHGLRVGLPYLLGRDRAAGVQARLLAPQQAPAALARADRPDLLAQQEPVERRVQLFRRLRGGPLVACGDAQQQGHRPALAAVVEAALVEDAQERVEDSGAALEQLVDERDGGLRQLADRDAPVAVLLQPGQTDG